MESAIKSFAASVAKEISERSVVDTQNISQMLEVRVKSLMMDFMRETLTVEEQRYLKLLEEQQLHRVGSPQYVAMGYKLAIAKSKKSTANRVISQLQREDKLAQLTNWVEVMFGMEALQSFYDRHENA